YTEDKSPSRGLFPSSPKYTTTSPAHNGPERCLPFSSLSPRHGLLDSSSSASGDFQHPAIAGAAVNAGPSRQMQALMEAQDRAQRKFVEEFSCAWYKEANVLHPPPVCDLDSTEATLLAAPGYKKRRCETPQI
ncbi:unnamed protein product, partial [Amoebophrya sp. A25]